MLYRVIAAIFTTSILLPLTLSAQTESQFSFNTSSDEASTESIQWNSDTHKDYYIDANGDEIKDLLLVALNDTQTTQFIQGTRFNDETQYLRANQLALSEDIVALLSAKKVKILPGYFDQGINEDAFIVTPKTEKAWLLKGSSSGLVSHHEYDISHFEWLDRAKKMELYKGDFNGDTIDDLLVLASKKGKHFLYHTGEAGEFSLTQKFKNAVKWGLKKSERLYIADFDNDGRDDIFALAKKRKKKSYVVYANKNGKLKNKHTYSLNPDFIDYEWFANGYSTLIDEDDNDEVNLVRMYNANGGIDTEGQFIPNEDDKLRFDKCQHLAFNPAKKSLKKKCRIKKKSRKKKNRNKTKKNTAGSTDNADLVAATNDPTLSASSTSYSRSTSNITPGRPGRLSNSAGAYPGVNQTFRLSWARVTNANRYELWVSENRGSIQNTFIYTSGTSLSIREGSPGSRLYYIRACNQNNCSGFSPYSSVYVYNKPEPVEVFYASPTTVTRAQLIRLAWMRPNGAIGSGAYYEIHETKPSGSRTHRVNGTGSNNLSYSFNLDNKIGQYKFKIRACNKSSAYCSPYSQYEIGVDYLSSSAQTSAISNLRFSPLIGSVGVNQRFHFDYTDATLCKASTGITYIDSTRSTQPLGANCAGGTTRVDNATSPPQLTGSYCWNTTRSAPTNLRFGVTCQNNQGGRDTANVAGAVLANRRPIAYNDFASSPRLVETGKSVTMNVVSNDIDQDYHTLSISSYSQPGIGNVRCSGSNCTYTAPSTPILGNIKRSTSFRYTVHDGWRGYSTATAYLKVFTDNLSAPKMTLTGEGYSPEVVKLGETQSFSFSYSNVLECGNSRGDTYVRARSDGAPQSGTYSWTTTRTSPGKMNFTVYCTNGQDRVNMNVRSETLPNRPPNAISDSAETEQDSSGVEVNVLSNDYDRDNNLFSIASFTQPANGVVSKINASNFRYRPNPSFAGTDTFTYTIADNWGGTSTATVTVTVIAKPIAELSNLVVTPEINIVGDSPSLSFDYQLASRCYNKDQPSEMYYDGVETSGSVNMSMEEYYLAEIRSLTVVCENDDYSAEETINIMYEPLPAVESLDTQ